LLFINRGFRVNHARAGKKCMGMTIPGNNSGVSIFRGNLTAIGASSEIKLIRVKTRLKTISPLVLSHLSSKVYPMAARTPPKRLAASILIVEATLEKSASLIV
jgi:hypothetical protein